MLQFLLTGRHRIIDSESTIIVDSEKSLLPKKEIRFKDEIPAVSKEDEYISALGDESTKPEQCYFCHGKDDLVFCTGGCNRAYHLRCIGMKASTNYETWKCKQCRGMALKSSDYHKKHCLKQWYLKSVVPLPSGEKSIVLEGIRCFDNTVWKCSPVLSVIDPTHFQTVNNTIYILIGEGDAKKSAANGFQQDVCDAFLKGIPKDWKTCIGECGTNSDFAQQPSDVSTEREVVEKEKDEKGKEVHPASTSDKDRPKKRRRAVIPSVRVIPLDSEEEDPPVAEPQEPTEFAQPVRRSSRIRMPPLAFWKNEYLRENVKTGRTELIVGSSNADLPSVMAHAFPLDPSPSVYEMVNAAVPSVKRKKSEEVKEKKKNGEVKEKKSGEKKEKKSEEVKEKKKEEKQKTEKKKDTKETAKLAKKSEKSKSAPAKKPTSNAPEPVFVQVCISRGFDP